MDKTVSTGGEDRVCEADELLSRASMPLPLGDFTPEIYRSISVGASF